jgi:serine/threonine protein kinase
MQSLVARTLRLLRQPPISRGLFISATRSSIILPADVQIEEERIPGYDPKRFLPVNPGDLLGDRYKILAKLGWGTTSTVWLAQDTQRYVLAWLCTCTYVLKMVVE